MFHGSALQAKGISLIDSVLVFPLARDDDGNTTDQPYSSRREERVCVSRLKNKTCGGAISIREEEDANRMIHQQTYIFIYMSNMPMYLYLTYISGRNRKTQRFTLMSMETKHSHERFDGRAINH